MFPMSRHKLKHQAILSILTTRLQMNIGKRIHIERLQILCVTGFTIHFVSFAMTPFSESRIRRRVCYGQTFDCRWNEHNVSQPMSAFSPSSLSHRSEKPFFLSILLSSIERHAKHIEYQNLVAQFCDTTSTTRATSADFCCTV